MIRFIFAALGSGMGAGAATGNGFWGSCLKGDVATLACIPNLYKQVVNISLFFAGFVALIFIIIGGIKYITSGGDPKQAGAARQVITYALIGLVLILLSFAIVNFLAFLTGAGCITDFGFDTCK